MRVERARGREGGLDRWALQNQKSLERTDFQGRFDARRSNIPGGERGCGAVYARWEWKHNISHWELARSVYVQGFWRVWEGTIQDRIRCELSTDTARLAEYVSSGPGTES